MIFLVAACSFLITFVLTPLTIRIARILKMVDDPSKRPHPAHTHTGVIPRAGGMPIYLGIIIPTFIFFPLNPQLIGIIIGITILLIVGLWDDKKSRSPYVRLGTNALAALIVVGSGTSIPYVTNPFGGILPLDTWIVQIPFTNGISLIVLADLLAFVWILWNTNIIGWSGGVDGQLPGFVAIAAIVIGLLSLRFVTADPNQLFVTSFSFLTAGAFLGFLPWNFYPQKIMPGYGGKTLAGFLLAVLSILAFGKLGTALLVLAIPITDALFVLAKRILAGRSPVLATSEHLHHHLLKLGWGKRQIAVFYWLVSACAGVAALTLSSKQKVFAFILILAVLFGIIVWVNVFRSISKRNS